MRRTLPPLLLLLLVLDAGTAWAQLTPAPRPTPRPDSRIESKREVQPDTSTFPPRPAGYRDAQDPKRGLRVTPLESLTAERIAALRQRAEADSRVKTALGTRFAYLSAALFESGPKSDGAPKRDAKLTYFNYATNRAVVVRFAGDQVRTVDVRPAGYQPPESDGEVAVATDVVRKDPRYATAVRDLPARGILTAAPEGHRYIYLVFKKPDQPAAFVATVDLTDRKVVSAGPVTHR